MNTCYYQNCASATNQLWSVSNTPVAPLMYQPFYVCHDHLKSEKVLEVAFNAMCQARFERQSGSRLEKNGWIFEKQVHTWKKANNGQACDDCEQINKLWIRDGYYPAYLCDIHLSRKTRTNDIGVGKYSPKEDTWFLDESSLPMMELDTSTEKQNKENSFVDSVITAAKSQFTLIMERVKSNNNNNKPFEFFTLSRREYTFTPISEPCNQDILYRCAKEKISLKIKEMFGSDFNVYAQRKNVKEDEHARYNNYTKNEKRSRDGTSFAQMKDLRRKGIGSGSGRFCDGYDSGDEWITLTKCYEIRALYITWDREHYDYE